MVMALPAPFMVALYRRVVMGQGIIPRPAQRPIALATYIAPSPLSP